MARAAATSPLLGEPHLATLPVLMLVSFSPRTPLSTVDAVAAVVAVAVRRAPRPRPRCASHCAQSSKSPHIISSFAPHFFAQKAAIFFSSSLEFAFNFSRVVAPKMAPSHRHSALRCAPISRLPVAAAAAANDGFGAAKRTVARVSRAPTPPQTSFACGRAQRRRTRPSGGAGGLRSIRANFSLPGARSRRRALRLSHAQPTARSTLVAGARRRTASFLTDLSIKRPHSRNPRK